MTSGVAVPSMRNNFAARFASDVYGLVTSLVAATITARVLGPAARGYYSSLVLLTVLLVQLFNGGLGEATVVLPRRGGRDHSAAVAATVALIGPLSVAGGFLTLFIGFLALHPTGSDERLALVLAAVLVVLNTCSTTIAWFLISQERLVLVAILTIVSATATTLSICAFVAVVHLGAAGAILGSIVGAAAILLPAARFTTRAGISLRPRWNGQYLRSAARFGLAVQTSNMLVQLTGRLDLLFVFRISGAAPAGRYSIALTIGALVGAVPMAISFTSFPRLPKVSDEAARDLTASVFRAGLAVALLSAAALGMLTPVLLPLVFGEAYRGAIAPTLILLPGGVLWSAQWTLTRAAAARGNARPLFVSFVLSFLVMVALDLMLISPYGIAGAALASLTSSVMGFVVAAVYELGSDSNWRRLRPRLADLHAIATISRQMAASLRGRGGRQPDLDPLAAPHL